MTAVDRPSPRITLHHADCMDVMRALPDGAFDLAIADPPYGRGEHGGIDRSHGVRQKNGAVLAVAGDGYARKAWDDAPASAEFFTELRRVSRHQIIFGVNYYGVALPGGRIIWDKVNDGADQSGAEILYCSLNERVDVVRYMWRGMMQGVSVEHGTVQQGDKSLNEKRIHPTQKPVKLLAWLLSKYAQPGWRILDTHMGSGSLEIAAHRTGFDVTGVELDADYYAAALQRIENECRQGSLFEEVRPHDRQ